MSSWKSLADCIVRKGKGKGRGRGGKAAPIDPALQRRLHRVRQGLTQYDLVQRSAVEPFAQSERPVTQAPGLLRRKAIAQALPGAGIVRHAPVALLGATECQEGIERCQPQADVLVKTDPDCAGAFIVTLQDGTLIGRIGAKSALARAIANADAVLAARITSIGAEDGKGQLLAPRIAVVTGPGDARPDMAWLENHHVHSVQLSGEQHFQTAIRKLALGEGVTLTSVTAHDHGEGATVAVNRRGEPLGYLPADSKLRDGVNNLNEVERAEVKTVCIGSGGLRTVFLAVHIGALDRTLRVAGSRPKRQVCPC